MSKGEVTMECGVEELRSALNGGVDCVLVDVREYPEFAGGRVAGAKLFPLGGLSRRAGEIDRNLPVYLICRTGRRSGEAQRELLSLGFKDVRNVKGGMIAWEKEGFPVERDRNAPWSLERQVRLVAGLMVLSSALLSVFVAQPFVWVAAFVGLGLAFAAITDSCAMGLLLARMPWNRANQNGGMTCPAEQALAED